MSQYAKTLSFWGVILLTLVLSMLSYAYSFGQTPPLDDHDYPYTIYAESEGHFDDQLVQVGDFQAGSLLEEGQHIVLSQSTQLDEDLVIDGILTVLPGAELNGGAFRIVVAEGGVLENHGDLQAAAIVVHKGGRLLNQERLQSPYLEIREGGLLRNNGEVNVATVSRQGRIEGEDGFSTVHDDGAPSPAEMYRITADMPTCEATPDQVVDTRSDYVDTAAVTWCGAPMTQTAELGNFKAAAFEKGYVKLTWTTFGEHEADLFLIERRRRGATAWETAVTVDANGTRNEPSHYEAFDTRADSGLFEYRLQVVDRMGYPTELAQDKVLLAGPLWEIDIWPNPANPTRQQHTMINVTIDGPEPREGWVEIIGPNGFVHHKRELRSLSPEIDVSDLEPALYTMRFTLDDHVINKRLHIRGY